MTLPLDTPRECSKFLEEQTKHLLSPVESFFTSPDLTAVGSLFSPSPAMVLCSHKPGFPVFSPQPKLANAFPRKSNCKS